jgi:hypothetical protein
MWNFNGPFTLVFKYFCKHYINFFVCSLTKSSISVQFRQAPLYEQGTFSCGTQTRTLTQILLVSPEQTLLEVYVIFVYNKTGNVRTNVTLRRVLAAIVAVEKR